MAFFTNAFELFWKKLRGYHHGSEFSTLPIWPGPENPDTIGNQASIVVEEAIGLLICPLTWQCIYTGGIITPPAKYWWDWGTHGAEELGSSLINLTLILNPMSLTANTWLICFFFSAAIPSLSEYRVHPSISNQPSANQALFQKLGAWPQLWIRFRS